MVLTIDSADFCVHEVITSEGMMRYRHVPSGTCTTRCSTSRTPNSSGFALRTIAAAGGLSYALDSYAVAGPHRADLGLHCGTIYTTAVPDVFEIDIHVQLSCSHTVHKK